VSRRDSLRSPLTSGQATKGWLVVGGPPGRALPNWFPQPRSCRAGAGPSRHELLGVLVLGAPPVRFPDGGHHYPDVVPVDHRDVGPHEPGEAVFGEGVGGHAVRVRGCDAGGLEDLADHGGPVGLVLGQGLAGPGAGDLDAAAAEAEVLPVMRPRGAHAGDHAGPACLGWMP
jgi:hypothetical protein